MKAAHPRSARDDRRRRTHLSTLAQLIAGDILAMPPTCIAFAIHPDRTVVVITADNATVTLTPATDGLYDIAGLIDHAESPTNVTTHVRT